MKVVRTTHENPDFIKLTKLLDMELNARYGKAQETYDKHNSTDAINTVIVGYIEAEPVACACFKSIDEYTIEIKRMFVASLHRRKGFSSIILQALEAWAAELNYSDAILETGKGQPEAIALYQKLGYFIIPNYGVYRGLDSSVCMTKRL